MNFTYSHTLQVNHAKLYWQCILPHKQLQSSFVFFFMQSHILTLNMPTRDLFLTVF